MHAIEDQFRSAAIDSGRIDITITGLTTPALTQIIIADNGIGLTNERFLAFCTADTDFKMSRGGKGIGRLLWLDAFDRIKVTSVYDEGGALQQRSFRFQLARSDQITEENVAPARDGAQLGTTLEFSGLRGAYATKFPAQANRLIRYFGAHFFAEFILEKAPQITLSMDVQSATFPADVRDLLSSERGEETVTTEEYGDLTLASFLCKKSASTEFDGLHQLHFVANDPTVTTRKIDGLLGIGGFGEANDLVYHGCVSGSFLDERVNQERTQFSFDELVSEDIAKSCAERIRANALKPEVEAFDSGRLETMKGFLDEYPSFQFETAESLLTKTPKNATKPEQFAQALIPARIRRDSERNRAVRQIVETLSGSRELPENFGDAIRRAADDVRAEEQRQLTEYVLRRKMVLDVLDVLIRRVRQTESGKDDHHLESTLHQFICPVKLRGDDPSQIESSDHDLWIIDERLAFAKYFASDMSFQTLLSSSKSGDRPDVFIFDCLHGLGIKTDEPLTRAMLVEFKKPGRRDYDERYSPLNQVSRYLTELSGGTIESFDRARIRVAPDCVFYCYIVADIVGSLDVHTSSWRTTANGRGRLLELGGKFRGAIEIIEWADLILDARARNQGFISAAGLSNRPA
jgi:hypothetical protein